MLHIQDGAVSKIISYIDIFIFLIMLESRN